MGAVVVYESMFGSTRAVAEAVVDGLRAAGLAAGAVEVGELVRTGGGLPTGTTVLVVGGPTHAFGMSRAATRTDAVKDAPEGRLVSTGAGLREWMGRLEVPAGLPVAAFDTKVDKPHLPGSAARAIARRLGLLGARPVVPARSFKVLGRTEGLLTGELSAARHWGRGLAVAAGLRGMAG